MRSVPTTQSSIVFMTALAAAFPAVAQENAIETRISALEAEIDRLSFGSGTEVEIYGYVKGDLIYDLDTDLGTTIFGLANLTPGSKTGSNFTGQAYQSRLGFRATTPTADGDFFVRVEGDFFGDGGGSFRLRHAYGEYRGFLVGQTWTNFMPIESYPGTLDFQGPAGIPFARKAQLRYSLDIGNGLGASFSIEEPAGNSDSPAATAALFYSGETYFVKLAALATTIDFNGRSFDGYGVNLSGNAQLWEGGSVQASFTTGEAISSYMVFGGADVISLAGGDRAVETTGVTLGVSQDLGERFSLGLAYGLREIDQGNAGDTESLETVHVGLRYTPVENVSFGIEYIAGTRDTFGGGSVSADRVQAAAQFSF